MEENNNENLNENENKRNKKVFDNARKVIEIVNRYTKNQGDER